MVSWTEGWGGFGFGVVTGRWGMERIAKLAPKWPPMSGGDARDWRKVRCAEEGRTAAPQMLAHITGNCKEERPLFVWC